MKRLIPIILITFLCIGNASAYITAEERKKFDDGLSRIEARKTNYNYRKQADRGRIERQREQKKAKLRRKKQLENIAKKNKATARQYEINATNERVRALRKGQCTTNTITGNFICK